MWVVVASVGIEAYGSCLQHLGHSGSCRTPRGPSGWPGLSLLRAFALGGYVQSLKVLPSFRKRPASLVGLWFHPGAGSARALALPSSHRGLTCSSSGRGGTAARFLVGLGPRPSTPLQGLPQTINRRFGF